MKNPIMYILLSSLFLIGCSNSEGAEGEEPVEEVIREQKLKIESLDELEDVKIDDFRPDLIKKFKDNEIDYEFLCNSQPCNLMTYANALVIFGDDMKVRRILYIKDRDKEIVDPMSLDFLTTEANRLSQIESNAQEESMEEVSHKIDTHKQERQEIIQGIIRIGMTSEEVLERWGKPEDINRTITADGTDEQWVYHGYKYLYFEDDVLTTIQD